MPESILPDAAGDNGATASTPRPVLQARAAMDGFSARHGAFSLTEITHHALLSLAFQPGDGAAVERALAAAFGIGTLPGPGQSSTGTDGCRLIGLQRDQVWLWWPDDTGTAGATPRSRIDTDTPLWPTDQSDGWAAFSLQGEACLTVLERLCQLDLHPDSFPSGSVGRTVIEHVGVILLAVDPQHFDVLVPRSSAFSFVHAVDSVARHVAAEATL